MQKDTQLCLLLCGLISVAQFAMIIYLPSLPQICIDLHTTPTLTELTITLFLFSYGLSQLIYGPLSDHFGRKPIILMGILGYSAFSLMSALAPSIELLLIARCLEGAGAGAITSLARASANDFFSGKKLVTVLSATAVASSLSSMISPTIGGWLTVGFNWRANFYFVMIYALVFFPLTMMLFKQIKPSRTSELSILRQTFAHYQQLLSNHEYVFFMLSGSFSITGLLVYYAATPFIFQHVLHFSPQAYGYFFLLTSSGFITGSFMNSYLHHYENRRLQISSIGLVTVCILMLILGLLGKISAWVMVGPMMFYMFFSGIIYPSAMTIAVRTFKVIAGTAAALMGCCQILFSSLATSIMAYLPQNNQIALACMLTFCAVCSATFTQLALKNASKKIVI